MGIPPFLPRGHNPSLIPALRLPRAAHACPAAGGAPVQSGTQPGHACCKRGHRADGWAPAPLAKRKR